jgi:hypothetical protein
MAKMMTVPIVKGKQSMEIDTEALPDDVYREALLQGLKVLLNRGMSKVTKTAFPEEKALADEAKSIAEKNYEAMKAGKIKFSGAKAKSVGGAVMTEARRLAKALVKDAMKAAGIKISHVDASEITKAANALIEQDPSIVEQAKANLEERAKQPVAIDVTKLISINPEKVAKAEAKKTSTKAAGQLSAKQAGKLKVRAKKPAAEATA